MWTIYHYVLAVPIAIFVLWVLVNLPVQEEYDEENQTDFGDDCAGAYAADADPDFDS